MKTIRRIMCGLGVIAAFISAGLSDGAYLLGMEAGTASDILFWVAVAMMLPSLFQLAKEGEL